MKKVLIIIFLFFYSFGIVNSSNCLIENGTSPLLDKYLKNLNIVLNNISKESKKISLDHRNYDNYSIKFFNDIFDFRNFKEEIDFYSIYRKFQEVPPQFERDYEKLLLEDNYMKEISLFIEKEGIKDFIFSKEKICGNIHNCSFGNNEKIGDILTYISINHQNIKSSYLKVFAGKEDFDKRKFILIENNFFNELNTYYGQQAMSECSEKKGFLKEVSNSTTKIFNNNKFANNGIKLWKETWGLLTGIDITSRENYFSLERELLKKELNRQGIGIDNQTNILDNLEKYNQNGGYSKNNNFIINTINQVKNKLNNKHQNLKQENISDFLKNYSEKSSHKNIYINDGLSSQKKSDNTKEIKSRIDKFYIEYKNYSSLSEFNNDNLKTRLINSHIELSNAINTLNETCKMAVRICNQQDTGNGNCGDCNW